MSNLVAILIASQFLLLGGEMISRDFLKGPSSGLEFMDFQNDTFFKELTEHLKAFITDGVLDKTVTKGMLSIIEKYSGFKNITTHIGPYGNLGVDTGYFSPNHVLNNKGLDGNYPTNQTTLYRWFKSNKKDIFKGHVDYTTGRVGGSFQEVPIGLYIEAKVTSIFSESLLSKYGISLEEALAGAIVHELGHAFGGCMMMFTSVSDNLLLKASLRSYRESRTKEERVVVLRDVKALLEVDNKDKTIEEIAEHGKDEVFVLYYNKLLTQRNKERSLSLGVADMSSEVIADMYSVRMGCGKGILGAVGVLVDNGGIRQGVNGMLFSALVIALIANPIAGVSLMAYFTIIGVSSSLIFISTYFGFSYAGVYNAGHRRFDDIIRQTIDQFKNSGEVPGKDKEEALVYLETMLVLNKKLIPWYDNTFVRRWVGAVMVGADFKASEVEHYVSVLSNHEVNLLGDKLKTINV